jgi:hypothetical protein
MKKKRIIGIDNMEILIPERIKNCVTHHIRDCMEWRMRKLEYQRINLRNELMRLMSILGKEDFDIVDKCIKEN